MAQSKILKSYIMHAIEPIQFFKERFHPEHSERLEGIIGWSLNIYTYMYVYVLIYLYTYI